MRSISRERAYNFTPIDSKSSSDTRQSTSATRSRDFNSKLKRDARNPTSKLPPSQALKSNLPPKPNTSNLNTRTKPCQFQNLLLENAQRPLKTELNPIENPITNDESLLTPCDWCGDLLNISLMFRTPKCKSHYYCRKCVVEPCRSNNSELCDLCLGYFSCIGKELSENQIKCNLCPKWPGSNGLNCKIHNYCAECKDFVVDNNYRYIVNLARCEVCVENLEKLKKLGKNRVSVGDVENKTDLVDANKDKMRFKQENRVYEKNYSSGSLSSNNIFKSKRNENSIKPVQKPIHKQESSENDLKTFEKPFRPCWCCKANIKTLNLQKTPNCDFHCYCESCFRNNLTNKTSVPCATCLVHFTSITKSETKKCKTCTKPSEDTELNCKLHQYCKECKENIVTRDFKDFIRLRECEDCVENAKKINEIKSSRVLGINPEIETFKTNEFPLNFYPESPKKKLKVAQNNSEFKIEFGNIVGNFEGSYSNLESISGRSSIVFDVSCSNCKGKTNVSGHLCNHNSCIFCLISSCLREILAFFQQYQADQNIIKKEFTYKCPKQDCIRVISVPTLMVLKNHMKFMNDPDYNSKNKIFEFITLENIRPWIPYFDGLSAWSVYE